jgi:hypothetical protein
MSPFSNLFLAVANLSLASIAVHYGYYGTATFNFGVFLMVLFAWHESEQAKWEIEEMEREIKRLEEQP